MVAIVAAIKVSSSFASQVSADPSKAESLASQFSGQGAALTTASANITKFAKDKCGIDLNSGSSSTVQLDLSRSRTGQSAGVRSAPA